MSDLTARLSLPLMAAAQSQKHVTHNEALVLLDALVQLAVLDRTRSIPPSAPAEGQRHLVAGPAAGPWAGKEGMVALWQDGAWRFLAPRAGWIAYVAAERICLAHDGGAWTDVKARAADQLGVNATPSAANPLTVGGDGALFTASARDHRLTINRAAANGTASIVFQSSYSGRAELGLAGAEDFTLKVSGDGAAWREALSVKRDTGMVALAAPVRAAGYAKSQLPAAGAAGPGAILYVADDAGGPVLAFSDGAAWRRVTDRAVVA